MAMVRAAVMAGFDNQVRHLKADPEKILRDNGFTSGFSSECDPDELLPHGGLRDTHGMKKISHFRFEINGKYSFQF